MNTGASTEDTCAVLECTSGSIDPFADDLTDDMHERVDRDAVRTCLGENLSMSNGLSDKGRERLNSEGNDSRK